MPRRHRGGFKERVLERQELLLGLLEPLRSGGLEAKCWWPVCGARVEASFSLSEMHLEAFRESQRWLLESNLKQLRELRQRRTACL